MFESCLEIRGHFSDYVDGICGPVTSRSIRYHLAHCAACRAELDRARELETDLRGLTRRQVPAELSLRLRVQISRRLHQNGLERLMIRLENMFRPVLIPSITGLFVALICIGVVMGVGSPRTSTIPDTPLTLVTPPRIQELAPMNFDTGDRPLVLVTYVNSHGEVTSYHVLSGQPSPELMKHLDQMMYFSLFRPATSFGQPTDGQIVLSLRRITVRG